ncbi:MFS transporter [Nonomuraea sp. bgisy101]|uniref:MFS transporter n=1 Tax=Nonomuraea sp. bgisy101 TaxID=3413784 RepID=UPI003D714448
MRQAWISLAVLCSGSALGLLDSTMMNVALPAVSADLGAGIDELFWALNSYLLTATVPLVTSGRLGDLFGPKPLFLAGIVTFTLASLACGLATTPGWLIAARAVQGLGCALFLPQGTTLVTQLFPPARRGAAWGVWGAVSGAAVAAGPAIGGFLVEPMGWRGIFLVNVPAGLLLTVLAVRLLPRRPVDRLRRFDLLGTVLLGLALFQIVFALIEAAPWWLAGGALTLGAFLLVQRARQHTDPLVPFAVFSSRTFRLITLGQTALPFGVSSTVLLTLLHLQAGAGLSPLRAGLLSGVAPTVSILFAPLSGRLTDRFGGGYVLLSGLGLMTVGCAVLGHAVWSGNGLLSGLVVFGIGMGVVFAPPGVLAMRDIEPGMAGAASGVFTLSGRIGGVVGTAVVGAVLKHLLPADALAGRSISAEVSHAVAFAYTLPAVALAVAAVLALAAESPSRRPARMPA